MCLQCMTKAEIFANGPENYEVLPGYILLRATKDAYEKDDPEWAKGEWGLVRCNDPDLIWAGEILEAPDGWGDDDKLDNDPAHAKYFDAVVAIADNLDCMSFADSTCLVNALGMASCNVTTYDVAEKLMPKLAAHIKTHSAKSEDEWECITRGCTMEEWEAFKRKVEEEWNSDAAEIKEEAFSKIK